MYAPQIVIDSNVLVAALRSNRGASFRLLSLVDSGKFEVNLSVPLVLEYEDACKRLVGQTPLKESDIDDVIDYLCRVGNKRVPYFLWRPFLQDPKDDMVLEVAIAGACDFLITYNKRDFQGADQFGIEVLTAREFLQRIGDLL